MFPPGGRGPGGSPGRRFRESKRRGHLRLSRFGATVTEAHASSIVEIEELGRRIRKLRSERRMTLKQVESVSGLSATHLSEIERGRTSPTIGALVRIARALEKDVSYFIEEEERPDVAHLLREQVAAVPAGDGVTAESLSPGIPGSCLFPYRVRIEPGAGAGLWLGAQDLPGDAIVNVQSGRLLAEVDGRPRSLGAGDTLQASLGVDLSLRAEGPEPAEIVLVSTRALGRTP